MSDDKIDFDPLLGEALDALDREKVAFTDFRRQVANALDWLPQTATRSEQARVHVRRLLTGDHPDALLDEITGLVTDTRQRTATPPPAAPPPPVEAETEPCPFEVTPFPWQHDASPEPLFSTVYDTGHAYSAVAYVELIHRVDGPAYWRGSVSCNVWFKPDARERQIFESILPIALRRSGRKDGYCIINTDAHVQVVRDWNSPANLILPGMSEEDKRAYWSTGWFYISRQDVLDGARETAGVLLRAWDAARHIAEMLDAEKRRDHTSALCHVELLAENINFESGL